VKLLAVSDLHCHERSSRALVERSVDADVVIVAGDLAKVHKGLEKTIGWLRQIETPTILVPGNNETDEALREACAGWAAATVLHSESVEIGGVEFFGLGAGIPTTPWDWSFDLTEEEAERELAALPETGVLVLHSPPLGHCDRRLGGESVGSSAIAAAIERAQPRLAVCGHIHESWGERSKIGETPVANLGPEGDWFEI